MKTTAAIVIAALAFLQSMSSTMAGRCDAIKDNIDFPGNDLITVAAASAENCCGECSRTELCFAFTWSQWNGGSCYLKTMAPANPVVAVPAADGSAYVRSGVVYKCDALKYNKDYAGTDIGSALSSSAENCCRICRMGGFMGCEAFSWTNYNGGTCWLKSASTDTFIDAPGVIAAFSR